MIFLILLISEDFFSRLLLNQSDFVLITILKEGDVCMCVYVFVICKNVQHA